MSDEEFKREHESYGMLHIMRTGGGTSAIKLFGSPLATHYGTIRLTISKATWSHGLHHDRFFGMSKEHIEIEMSQAQFADAITSLNIGTGTPCTIRYIAGKRVENPPDFPTEAEHIRESFDGSLDGFAAKAQKYADQIKELTAKLPAKTRREIEIALDVIQHQLTSNVPFVVKQFQEATTKITTAAKAEVDGFVTATIRSAGLQSIAEGRLPPLMLASPSEPGPRKPRRVIKAGVCSTCDRADDCVGQCPNAGCMRCDHDHFQNCAALLNGDDEACDCGHGEKP